MSYTRKEIVIWVQSQTKYRFEQLKNGVFFCRMLSIKFPQDSARFKYNAAPISEYEYTCNLVAMKKVLNKHGLQENLNINSILNSKNNFELAKWFRAFVDKDIQIDNNVSRNSYQNVLSLTKDSTAFRNLSKDATAFQSSSKNSSFHKMQNEANKNSVQTPRHRFDESVPNQRKQLESAQKGKSKTSYSNIKRVSMAKSENHFFKERKPICPELKIPINRAKKESPMKVVESEVFKQPQLEDKIQETISNLMYETALEESIQSFQKILKKLQGIISENDEKNYEKFREKVSSAIFGK